MKNVIIGILLLTTVVAGYIAAINTFRLELEGLKGKLATVERGDIALPINATGEVKSAYRIEIKAEASGEVIEITRQAGDRVKDGETLIRLQKDDEQRSVDRAEQELEIAAAKLEATRLSLKQAETADLENAQANVERLAAAVELAKFRLDKLAALAEHQRNDEEILQRETTYKGQLAELAAARAALKGAELAIPLTKQTVRQAEAAFQTAQTTLGDAAKRLTKTDIISPIDGVVADIRTQIGEVIQGGKTTLTGGTVLAILLDADDLIVRAEVDEADIGRVLSIAPPWAQPGRDSSVKMPANLRDVAETIEHRPVITVESFRDEEFEGVIERIYPEPRILSGVVTYLVDVVIISENRSKILTGMRADVEFTSDHAEDVLLCPNEAIREGEGGRLGVHVPKKGSRPDQRETEFIPCEFGLDNGNVSEVLTGLAEGASVYTKLPVKKDEG